MCSKMMNQSNLKIKVTQRDGEIETSLQYLLNIIFYETAD